MKQWEIIREAQENGAKIRKKCWSDKQIHLVWGDGKWVDEYGKEFSVLLDRGEWELYIEPIKTFGPDRAMYWLERGKMVRNKLWRSGGYVKKRETGLVSHENIYQSIADWFHTDWHLCDSDGNYVPEPEEGYELGKVQ